MQGADYMVNGIYPKGIAVRRLAHLAFVMRSRVGVWKQRKEVILEVYLPNSYGSWGWKSPG